MTDFMALDADEFKKLSYEEQFIAKKQFLRSLLLDFYPQELDSFESSAQHYRMRAEFRIWHEGDDSYHIMFNQTSKEQYRVDELPSACLLINEFMSSVIKFVKHSPILRTKLFQIDYLASTTDEIVVSMVYHKKLSEEWQSEARNLQNAIQQKCKVSIIGRARKQKLVVGDDFVTEKLSINDRTFTFKQVENSFTQPNALINIKMIEWVIKNIKPANLDLLELYCGAGNFSIPLSLYFRKVLATEISKSSVYAAQHNIEINDIENLLIARLSSEEFVEAYTKVRAFRRLGEIDLDGYDFSTVLVDPPRSGLDATTLKLVAKFDTIIYVSCNPTTLKNNLEALNKTHEVKKVAFFDQFPFTQHLESGVILKKR
jgi:tRNA (uracil-5-)-methyltransferase